MPYADPKKQEEYNIAYRKRRRKELNAREVKRYHEEGYKEKQKAYRKSNLAYYAEWQRNWRKDNPRDVLVINARVRANKFKLPCNITVDSIEWPTHCPIFGIELDYNRSVPGDRKQRSNYPTLDRRINKLGYVNGNTFVISHRANRIKSDATLKELEAIIKYIKGGP